MQNRIALCRQRCQQAIQETIRAEVEGSFRSPAEGQPASGSVRATLEDARRQTCICLAGPAGVLLRLPHLCVRYIKERL